MQDLANYFFGPIGVQYCNYFYILTVLTFFILVIALVQLVVDLLTKGKINYLLRFGIIFQALLLYFVNRLFYTMCVSALMV